MKTVQAMSARGESARGGTGRGYRASQSRVKAAIAS
jgi:hypothetical protein